MGLWAIIITPPQTLAILKSLPSPLHFTLVLTCAATALRSSEILALRWADVLWSEGRIRISKRWAKGEDGETKTDTSDGYVPLQAILAGHLRSWHRQTPHAKDTDFVFPSMKEVGKKPLYAPVSLPIICVRPQKRPEWTLETGSASGFTISATHLATGW